MLRSVPFRVFALVLPALIAVVLHSATERILERASAPLPAVKTLRFDETLARLPWFSPSDVPVGVAVPLPARVERGATLVSLFSDLGIDDAGASAAAMELARFVAPRELRAGERYSSYHDGATLTAVALERPGEGTVHVERTPAGWTARFDAYLRSRRARIVSGTLETSLQEAIREAGGPTLLAASMARVLQWDLDFHRDLRRGDSFEVIFEEVLLDGRPSSLGEVLALRYENRGHSLEAYRFGATGHYDAEGRPMRKLFLRSPLEFSRVTSRFSHRRLHPVTRQYRPHWGVDYGAPVGTPVRATASGVVQSARWVRGGGNTLRIRHTNGYVTGYLHLSRFASGVAAGRRVNQGQTVGYVGATGLVTGPHLDYRVQRNGRWIDPSGLGNEPAPPIPPAELARFESRRDLLKKHLSSRSGRLPNSLLEPEPYGEATLAGAY